MSAPPDLLLDPELEGHGSGPGDEPRDPIDPDIRELSLGRVFDTYQRPGEHGGEDEVTSDVVSSPGSRERGTTEASKRTAISQTVEMLLRSPSRVATAVAAALRDLDSTDNLDPSLWGEAPTDEQYLRATVRAQEAIADLRRSLLDDASTVDEVAAMLGVGPEEIRAGIARRELVAIRDGEGAQRLPAWQFAEGGQPLQGLDEVRAAFPGDVVALSSWMLSPSVDLDGDRPVDLVRAGAVDQVVAAAVRLHG
jgi:hypothetical protein